jgi:hypothetical protein
VAGPTTLSSLSTASGTPASSLIERRFRRFHAENCCRKRRIGCDIFPVVHAGVLSGRTSGTHSATESRTVGWNKPRVSNSIRSARGSWCAAIRRWDASCAVN